MLHAMIEQRDNAEDELIAAVAFTLAQRPEVGAAYLYGSVAKGRATPLSDIDVAIVAANGVAPTVRGALLRDLSVDLARARPGAVFDVRFLDELPVSVRGRVVTEGRRLLDRDSSCRLEAEVRARMEYHDFLIFEREGVREGMRGLREAVRGG